MQLHVQCVRVSFVFPSEL